VGKDVILFTILRSELPAARGTVISINPNTMVGGQPLGNEYCEVVVNVVMKRDAMLPRSYGDMKTMASALKMSIAWPYNKVIN
uniref:Transposase Tnp1/En/Spm-like domain-containing protein n=1 Tax=Oryza brachyantha TaxID=4533 RepID=J3NCL5_ORYBR